jgi:hypothetical protein
MENVWKIGARWSTTGTPESVIIDIFKKYQIVFLGEETKRFLSDVKIGDYIAIADGLTVDTLAQVIDTPKSVTNLGFDFTEEEKTRFTYEDKVAGAKVNIVRLNPEDSFSCTRGTFFKAKSIHNEVIEKFNKYHI